MPSSTSLFCPHCGASNPPKNTVCFACQQPLLSDSSPAPVHLLKQRYSILRPLGQGGMGAVYEAEDTELGNRRIAVKEMSQRSLSASEITAAADSFKHEAHLLAALTHPHLPRIYDHFSEDGRWYLVMDFIEGETFEAYLDRHTSVLLPLDEILDYALQLCSVLDYLHTRQPPIIFRDLKPSNIMRSSDGQLYLIDFGIARLFKPGQARDTIAFGSPGYAAPEQYGKMQTTPRADLYSLGALLHQMLTGLDPSDTPFFFSPVPKNRASVSLQTLVGQLLDMNVTGRPSSAAIVRQSLQAIVKQQLISPSLFSSSAKVFTSRRSLPPVQPQLPVPSIPLPPLLPPPPSTLGTLVSRYDQHTGWISSLSWSPNGKYLATASHDGTVQVWNPLNALLWRIYKDHRLNWFSPGRVYAAVWSPDSQRIASAGDDRVIRIWQVDTTDQHSAYKVHPTQIRTLSWSPNGTLFASTHDSMVRVWQPQDGRDIRSFDGGVGTILASGWSPDSRRLAVGGNGTLLRIYELMAQDTQKVQTFQGHTKAIQTLSWSPDGLYIATGSDDGTVRVWEALSGHAILGYDGHNGPIKAVAWSPDGRHLASGGEDATVQIWTALSDKLEYVYRGHFVSILQIAWSPDSTLLASSDVHKLIQVWHAV